MHVVFCNNEITRATSRDECLREAVTRMMAHVGDHLMVYLTGFDVREVVPIIEIPERGGDKLVDLVTRAVGGDADHFNNFADPKSLTSVVEGDDTYSRYHSVDVVRCNFEPT